MRMVEWPDRKLFLDFARMLARQGQTPTTWPAVKRGRMVNRLSGEPSSQLHERHDASDFDTKTQDKLAAAD